MKEKEILKGPNFASLPGNLTEEAIQIVKMLREDAKENNKELWLLMQDMKKAYDSVSMKSLQLALQRIKLPVEIVRFITELYSRREVSIITEFGLTKKFIAENGIEQGETILLLVWRIFYDPLLRRIQDDQQLGYEIETFEVLNLQMNRVKVKRARQAAVAYADDTTWMAKSKEEMQEIVQISQRFFRFNDI